MVFIISGYESASTPANNPDWDGANEYATLDEAISASVAWIGGSANRVTTVIQMLPYGLGSTSRHGRPVREVSSNGIAVLDQVSERVNTPLSAEVASSLVRRGHTTIIASPRGPEAAVAAITKTLGPGVWVPNQPRERFSYRRGTQAGRAFPMFLGAIVSGSITSVGDTRLELTFRSTARKVAAIPALALLFGLIGSTLLVKFLKRSEAVCGNLCSVGDYVSLFGVASIFSGVLFAVVFFFRSFRPNRYRKEIERDLCLALNQLPAE
jgi:hypothetical protein